MITCASPFSRSWSSKPLKGFWNSSYRLSVAGKTCSASQSARQPIAYNCFFRPIENLDWTCLRSARRLEFRKYSQPPEDRASHYVPRPHQARSKQSPKEENVSTQLAPVEEIMQPN